MRRISQVLVLVVSGILAACNPDKGEKEQLVNLEVAKDDPQAQLANLNAAIGMAKNDGTLYARRAIVLLKKGELDRALEDAEEAVRLTKNEPATLFVKAQVLRVIGRQEEALKLALQAERNSYQSSSLYVLLGELYLQRKQYKEAKEYIRKAQEISPADEFAFYYKAWIQAATGDTARAIYNYKEALEQAPEFMEPKRELTGILVNHREYDAANVYLRQAEKQAPKDAQLLYYKGLLYEAAQKGDSAQMFFTRAVALNDTLQGAHYKLALRRYTSGDYEAAITHFLKAKEAYGHEKKYLANLADSYERTNQNLESLLTYQKLLKVEPKYTYAYKAIARLKYKLSKPQPDTVAVQSSESIEN